MNVFRVSLVLVLLAFAPLSHAQQAPSDASAVLSAAMNHVKGLSSVSVDIVMRQHMQMQGRDSRAELTASLVLRGTSDLYAHVKNPSSEAEFYANANKQMIHLVSEKQYAEKPSTRQGLIALMGGGIINMGALWMGKFLEADPSLMAMATATEDKGLEQPGGEGTPKQRHILITTAKFDADVWLADGAAPLMQRFVLDFSKGFSKTPGGGKATVEFTFANWQPGVSVTDDRFVFTPPEGVTLFDLKAAAEEQKDPLVGKPAPALTLDLMDGGTLDLASHKGKNVVILDFFATWCRPCRMSMPTVVEVAKRYADKGVVLYAVNSGEEPALIKSFLSDAGITIAVAIDKSRRAASDYQASSIPRMAIIGKDGVVYAAHRGVGPNFAEELTAEIEGALAGKSPETGK